MPSGRDGKACASAAALAESDGTGGGSDSSDSSGGTGGTGTGTGTGGSLPPLAMSAADAGLSPRAAELVRTLQLQPHPEGGHYAEVFRSATVLATGRGPRHALTTIDFLLARGQWSAWHCVQSDEIWHLLEGGPLQLWLLPPDLSGIQVVDLSAGQRRRHAVPAGWWQAAEPQGDFAYVGATVGPGFDFADFSFGRDDAGLRHALAALAPALLRLLG